MAGEFCWGGKVVGGCVKPPRGDHREMSTHCRRLETVLFQTDLRLQKFNYTTEGKAGVEIVKDEQS